MRIAAGRVLGGSQIKRRIGAKKFCSFFFHVEFVLVDDSWWVLSIQPKFIAHLACLERRDSTSFY